MFPLKKRVPDEEWFRRRLALRIIQLWQMERLKMKTTVPTARLCDTDAEKKAKLRRASKMRAIDKGKIYDVTGKLRKLVREIESGKLGDVTGAVVAIRCIQNGRVTIDYITPGVSQPEVLHFMACYLQKVILA